MEFTNNCNLINQMLLSDEFHYFYQLDSFLVHSAIYPMVQKYLSRTGYNDWQHLGNYELTVGAYSFDMEVLFFGRVSSLALFWKIFSISQFTHFWDDGINLFREVDRYHELQEFIAIYGLERHVISVEEICGTNSLGKTIKIVTFDSTSDEIQRDELLENYKEFLLTKSLIATSYDQICHYYFTKTLPWHKLSMFHMYRSQFLNQRIFLELQTFLTCMRELTYERESFVDLISLCSLKLAFCDELNLTEASRDLQFEIDALIERFLRRMVKKQTYIQNGEFDLNRYALDNNLSFANINPAAHNLIYTFQHIFHCTNLFGNGWYNGSPFIYLNEILMLKDEKKDLKILRDRSNIPYEVDCKNYNKLNSKLFCELLNLANVNKIKLDTNYRWTIEPYLNDFTGRDSKCVWILLVGTNEFNFIEDFAQFLKIMPTTLISRMVLNIQEVTLKSYNILKNLKVCNLRFYGSKITFTMLTELLACDLKGQIYFEKCTIEDHPEIWSLLINGFNRTNVIVEILEEEKTLQYLFESITNHLTKFKLNEFQFKCNFDIICMEPFGVETLEFRRKKFRFDEFNTRLEFQNENGREIDLYDWKNYTKFEDDYKNFEFYK